MGISALNGPNIRLTPISLPKFSGDRRDYWRWKAEWESIQAQAEPTGSRECKKLHLLDSIGETVKSDLRLSRCRDAIDIFMELENRYGDKAQTAEGIVLELHSRPAVKNHQPRETLELILAVGSIGPHRPGVRRRYTESAGDSVFREQTP